MQHLAVRLCQSQICISEAFGGRPKSRTPEFTWLGPAGFHRSLEISDRIKCGHRMVPFPPFLSGSCCLSFLGWQTDQSHLRSPPAGPQGQACHLQRTSREERTGTVLAGYRQPLKPLNTLGRASWALGTKDPDMTQPSPVSTHSLSKSA